MLWECDTELLILTTPLQSVTVSVSVSVSVFVSVSDSAETAGTTRHKTSRILPVP